MGCSRIHRWVLNIALLFVSISSFSQPYGKLVINGQAHGSAPTYTDSLNAFVTRLSALGGTALTDTQKARADRFYQWANTNHQYDTIIYFNIGFDGNLTASAMNMMRPSTTNAGTWNGSPTIATGGYTGNGTSQYLDVGKTLTAIGGTINKTGMFIVSNTNSGSSKVDMGAWDASHFSNISIDGGAFVTINDGATGSYSSPTFDSGFFYINRTSSTVAQWYRNAVIINAGDAAGTSTAIPTTNLYIGAVNNNGTALDFDTRQIWAWGVSVNATLATVKILYAHLRLQSTWWNRSF